MQSFKTVSGEARSPKSNYLPSSGAILVPSDGLPNNAFQGQPIALRHVRRLTNSNAYAAAHGMPLTAHVTIHFRLAEGFTREAWARFQTRLLDKASRWLKRQGVPVAFVWTREDGPRKGPHLHLLIHLPRRLWGAFHRFLLSAGRFQTADGTSEAIVISGGQWGMLVETMRAGALRYVLKSLSASPGTLDALGIRPHATKPMLLQRCGVSNTLSQKARRESGWIELKSIPELHAQLNPANDNRAEAAHVEA
jgi:hypothetical protein